ncbi:hypothetical protein CN065_14155 [Sinorhizobium meliloti]|uniref:hypothetical protein n=1 Tax=Rhizobium meliloti TaxID=382 RepID=UPI000B49A7D3|nr:hypothetical protein [Sinorhizobium meliloti]ASP98430.1 hypothetical protein CDO24_13905 [Sinorhizobium meliloti]MQV66175.1 hypothetical protein [Sinorhizobium meliloti]RVQ39335.1 hypothetical protein CN065_14155 [Sinorhizobium meliloti]
MVVPLSHIALLFPTDLYARLLTRFGPDFDVTKLVVSLASKHVAEADTLVVEKETFEKVTSPLFDDGDPNGGLAWSPLFLVNGTQLRMSYGQRTYHARIRFDQVQYGEEQFPTMSQWVRKVANGTSRNAWHDVWFKTPDSDAFQYADAMRQVKRTGAFA